MVWNTCDYLSWRENVFESDSKFIEIVWLGGLFHSFFFHLELFFWLLNCLIVFQNLICSNLAEYEEMAVTLAQDVHKLYDMRLHLERCRYNSFQSLQLFDLLFLTTIQLSEILVHCLTLSDGFETMSKDWQRSGRWVFVCLFDSLIDCHLFDWLFGSSICLIRRNWRKVKFQKMFMSRMMLQLWLFKKNNCSDKKWSDVKEWMNEEIAVVVQVLWV